MSAIFGFFNLDGRPADVDELERMSAALAADGPDGGGVWAHGPVGLGQRLMRFTPEDTFEQQPLAGCGGQVVLVADARIDNRPELARTFGLASHEAAVMPDSAFLMRAYERWGQECVQHLAGEFAFAVWDARTQSLFAACSPLAQRALHYHNTPHGFAFATMPRGLVALSTIPRVLNEAKVADYLMRTRREMDATFYKDIRVLRSGHSLTVGRNGLKIARYWKPDLARRIRYKNDDDYVEAFLELFDRVVQGHLRSATPVGAFMSGGLDSSAVAVTAAGLLKPGGGRVSTYTEVPPEGFVLPPEGRYYANETPFVQAIGRRHSNIDLNFVRTDGHYFLEDLDSFFRYAECPFRNTSNRVWLEAIMRLAKEQGNRVLLNGNTGNLTLSWNGRGLLAELTREGKWKRALHEVRTSAPPGRKGGALRMLASRGLLPFLPASMLIAIARFRSHSGDQSHREADCAPIHPDFLVGQQMREHLRQEEAAALHKQRTDWRGLRLQLMDSDFAGPMMSGFRAMYGVENRDPTSDSRIAEFCLALPEEQCARNGESRLMIRRAMADRLPAEVLGNRGRGMQAGDWLDRQDAARAQIAEELIAMERNDTVCRLLDMKRLRRTFEGRPAATGDAESKRIEYHLTFETGLMVGRFLRWFEKGG